MNMAHLLHHELGIESCSCYDAFTSGYSRFIVQKVILRQFKSEVQHHLIAPRIPHEEFDNPTTFSVDG